MYYNLLVLRENCNVTAEIQDPESGWRKEFDISTVIGDYLLAEKKRQEKPGRPQIYYKLEGHIFDEAWCRMGSAWMEYYASDVKTSFKFLKEAIKILNAPKLAFPKREASLGALRNKHMMRLNFQATLCDEDQSESEGVVSFDKPIDRFVEFSKPKSGTGNIDTWFQYECRSISDMVAAIIHYYMVYGFKVISCKHCGRIFATQSLKTVYCSRISPYKNRFSQKRSRPESCKDTVKREIQFLKNKKGKLLDRIRNSSDVMRGYTEDIYNDIYCKCNEYMEQVSKSPTPKLLDEFNYYLERTAQERKWKNECRDLRPILF